MTKRLKTKMTIAMAAAMLGLGQMAYADPPASVQNFTLIDQSGAAHELYSHLAAPVIVIATHVNGDKLSQDSTKSLQDLKGVFKTAEYFLLNSSTTDTRATIAAEASAQGITIPVLDDEHQQVARNLGVTQTGEAYIIDPVGWKVLYHGPVNAAAARNPDDQFLLFNAMVYAMSHRPMDQSAVEVRGTPISLAAE